MSDDDVRVSLRMAPQQVERIEQLIEAGHYRSRSEAIRAAVEVQHSRLFEGGRSRPPRGGDK